MQTASPTRVQFENSAPILRVDNLKNSVGFYTKLLGFEAAAWGNADFTHVSRDRAGIYLCQGSQGRGGAWIWVGVEDVSQLYLELRDRHVPILLPPTNYPWALEMRVEDPDGNVLRFGSEPKQDEPFIDPS
jgi:catechol 2,3-dioxygenase-like lactoylglutathione lyase family enzyme